MNSPMGIISSWAPLQLIQAHRTTELYKSFRLQITYLEKRWSNDYRADLDIRTRHA